MVPPVGGGILPFLSAFAATDAAVASNGSKTVVTEFPGEHPTDKELADWLEVVLPALRMTFGAVMADAWTDPGAPSTV